MNYEILIDFENFNFTKQDCIMGQIVKQFKSKYYELDNIQAEDLFVNEKTYHELQLIFKDYYTTINKKYSLEKLKSDIEIYNLMYGPCVDNILNDNIIIYRKP